MRFLRGDKMIVSGTLDGRVRLWDVSQDRALALVQAHLASILALDVAPNGQRLATTGDDGSVAVWDLAGKTLTLRRRLRLAPWCSAVRFHPSGLLAVGCSDLTVRIIDPNDGHEVRRFTTPGNAQYGSVDVLAISADGQFLATASPLTLWNWKTGTAEKQLGAVLPLGVAFSPSANRLAAGSMVAGGTVWDIGAATLVTRLTAIASGRVWGATNFPLVNISMPIVGVAYSPSGDAIAAGGVDNVVQLWAGESKDALTVPLARLEIHEGTISDLAFSQRGHLLASASLDGTVAVWRLH